MSWSQYGRTPRRRNLGGNKVLYIANKYNVTSIDPDNGNTNWQYNHGAIMEYTGIAVSPYNGKLYVGDNNGKLLELTDSNGSFSVTELFDVGSAMWHVPLVADDGTIYVADNTNTIIYAVNPDGTEKWNYTTMEEPVCSSHPCLGSNGVIYFVTTQGLGDSGQELIGIKDNGTGASLVAYYDFRDEGHNTSTGDTYCPCPALDEDNNRVYVALGWNANIFVLDLDGNYIGEYDIKGGTNPDVWFCPTIDSNGDLYIGNDEGDIFAVNFNLTEKWTILNIEGTTQQIRSQIALSPDESTIYVATYSGNLYAIKASDGTINWKYTLNDGVDSSSPIIGSDGTIYIGDISGYVYALTDNGGSVSEKWTPKDLGGYIFTQPCIIDTSFKTYGNVYDIVRSTSTGIWKPVDGAEVTLGEKSTTTDANGNYEHLYLPDELPQDVTAKVKAARFMHLELPVHIPKSDKNIDFYIWLNRRYT